MYDYVAVRLNADPCNEDITDLLAAFLAEGEFETFEPDAEGLTAYVRKDKYDFEFLRKVIEQFPMETNLNITEKEIKGEDWNKEWEQNYFKPIKIGDKLLVRSSFHATDIPAEIEIVIDPKMAFGTGHHATTAGMSQMLLEEELRGKSVIDMGTGTGILAILAKKLGAGETIGIDIDEFAIENARENGELNKEQINWIAGDHNALENMTPTDIFLANINLNVIISNLDNYVKKIKTDGLIFLSGFLDTDRLAILSAAEKKGLSLIKEMEENHWMTMVFRKGSNDKDIKKIMF